MAGMSVRAPISRSSDAPSRNTGSIKFNSLWPVSKTE